MTAQLAVTDALDGASYVVGHPDQTARHAVDGLAPEAVAYPSSVDELSPIMEVASERGFAVAPWGGGTRMAVGNPPERLDLVVDLSRLDRVIAHNPADLTATVQAGINVQRLQDTLGEYGQFLAIDPPLPRRATIGGTLATAVSGPLKWQYGSPRDTVIGMKVVQADGKVTKSGGQVVKNVSGYDMSRLHIGGLGTLGIISEVSLKLTPLPAGQATILARYATSRDCIDAALSVFQSNVLPLALATYDAAAAARMGAPSADGQSILAVRLGGRPRTLERMVGECRDICRRVAQSSPEVVDRAEADRLWRDLADFGWSEDTAPAIGARASVLPSRVSDLVESIAALASSGPLQPAAVTHPAHGTALICWYASESGASVSPEHVEMATSRTIDAVRRLGGSIVIEQCPVETKTRIDVWDRVGEPLATMRRLKEQYDPRRVLNPGRFVGGI